MVRCCGTDMGQLAGNEVGLQYHQDRFGKFPTEEGRGTSVRVKACPPTRACAKFNRNGTKLSTFGGPRRSQFLGA